LREWRFDRRGHSWSAVQHRFRSLREQRAEERKSRAWSKRIPQHELHDPRQSRARNYAELLRGFKICARASPLRVVERIEHLPAELERVSLADAGVLENLQVPVVDARAGENIPAGVAHACLSPAGREESKRADIVKSLDRALTLIEVAIADAVRASAAS